MPVFACTKSCAVDPHAICAAQRRNKRSAPARRGVLGFMDMDRPSPAGAARTPQPQRNVSASRDDSAQICAARRPSEPRGDRVVTGRQERPRCASRVDVPVGVGAVLVSSAPSLSSAPFSSVTAPSLSSAAPFPEAGQEASFYPPWGGSWQARRPRHDDEPRPVALGGRGDARGGVGAQRGDPVAERQLARRRGIGVLHRARAERAAVVGGHVAAGHLDGVGPGRPDDAGPARGGGLPGSASRRQRPNLRGP